MAPLNGTFCSENTQRKENCRGSEMFDIVIGNPPYGARYTPEEKIFLKTHYKHQDYQPESYLFFSEKAFELLKLSGIFAFIIPNTWLINLKLRKIRLFMIGENTLISLLHYHKKFFNAVVDTEIVIAKKGFKKNNIISVFQHKTKRDTKIIYQNQDNWVMKNGDAVNIFTSDEIENLVKKLKLQSKPLSEYANVYAGLVAYEEGKGNPPQTRGMMKAKCYNLDFQKDGTYRKVLKGADINKYVNNWNGKRWLKYGINLAAPRNQKIFDQEKIVVRQTGDSLIATLDNQKFVCLKNIHIINAKDGVNLKLLLGLINSKLLNFYFQYLNPEIGETLAEVKKENVEKLLIKIPENQQSIINCVNQILSIKKENSTAEISDLEKRIDRLVYKLYELEEHEIKLIENQ